MITLPSVRARATRPARRRATVPVVVIMSIAGCGGDSDSADQAADQPTDQPATETTTAPEETPATDPPSADQLGDEIAAVYLSVYDDVVAALEDRPDPAEAEAQLTELKDTAIERLVALGHRREALDAASRAGIDGTVSSALMRLPETTLAEYQAAIDHYANEPELADLIRSFNIIGQYANFDLLRQQEPDEAARLGIG